MKTEHKHLRTIESALPNYRGKSWIESKLPERYELWLPGDPHTVVTEPAGHLPLNEELRSVIERHVWKWPKQTVYFISDLHADTDAFIASLVASGGIRKTGSRDEDFKLTKPGRKACFLLGGDCFDKGPSTLRLLRAIRSLKKKGACLRILAGNHDVRIMLGIRSVGVDPDPRTNHFFVRLGPKVIPLLKEIHEQYVRGPNALRDIPSKRECKKRLYPSKHWFREFPSLARWVMPDSGIEREMQRLRTKMERFESECNRSGLSLRMVYAAAIKWQKIFLQPKGEFSWFYQRMRLAYRSGSFLFIHAGLDDRIARNISEDGIKHLNREFRAQMDKDLFDFYYGPLANTIRTKYRDVDRPLTRLGVKRVHQKGIHAIVHGHRNLLHGQRIMVRKGIINFECDTTLDRATREKEGLDGVGAAVTIFHPDGLALGISSDYPCVKVFEPRLLRSQLLTRG